jgi:hypothetical protein
MSETIPLGLAKDKTVRELLESLAATISTSDTSAHALLGELHSVMAACLSVSFPSPQPVNASSLPLPTGAATQTTLAELLARTRETLSVSAASLPLPTGAATQTTLAAVLTALQGSLSTTSTGFTSKPVNSSGATVIKGSAGVLHTLTVLGGVAGSIVAYDNATKAEGTALVPVFNLLSIGTPFTLTFDAAFSNGLVLNLGAATALQVSYT